MGTAIADIVWDCMYTGKMEGINNKIKSVHRQEYGYPNDEYFFLKLMDMSRVDYVRTPKFHKFYDWAKLCMTNTRLE